MKQSENVSDLLAALVEAQAEFPTMPKDKTAGSGAYSYKYADLDTIATAIKPILKKNGLGYTQSVECGGSGLTLCTRVFHKSGQWIEGEALLPVITNTKSNAAQSMGMSITYMRRYALSAMLGITSDEDTDANFNAPQKPLSPEAAAMRKAEKKPMFTDAQKEEMKKWPEAFSAEELAEFKAKCATEDAGKLFAAQKAEFDKRKAAAKPAEEIY